MTGLGIIGLGAAIANYRKAKKEYEQALLEDNTDAILAAISQYNTHKYDSLDQYDKDEFKPKETDLFTVVPILNAGMMVGDLCRLQGVFELINNTNHPFEIAELEVIIKVYGTDTIAYQAKDVKVDPNGIAEIKFIPRFMAYETKQPFTLSDWIKNAVMESMSDVYPMTEALKKARDAVRTANQRGSYKPDIALCKPNTCIIGVPPCVTADVWIKYNGFSADLQGIEEKKNVPGTFCYKGEAFYPYRDK